MPDSHLFIQDIPWRSFGNLVQRLLAWVEDTGHTAEGYDALCVAGDSLLSWKNTSSIFHGVSRPAT